MMPAKPAAPKRKRGRGRPFTVENRVRWFGLRRCHYCGKEYAPWYKGQRFCSRSHGMRAAWRNGRFRNRKRANYSDIGRKAAWTKRRETMERVARRFHQGPITEREFAIYKLGWKQCMVTHQGHWRREAKRAARRRREIAEMLNVEARRA